MLLWSSAASLRVPPERVFHHSADGSDRDLDSLLAEEYELFLAISHFPFPHCWLEKDGYVFTLFVSPYDGLHFLVGLSKWTEIFSEAAADRYTVTEHKIRKQFLFSLIDFPKKERPSLCSSLAKL